MIGVILFFIFSFNCYSSQITNPICNITDELALSALKRAKSPECKQEIERLACSIKDQFENGNENTDGVYRIRLKSSCPYSFRNELVGCQLRNDFIEFVENYNKTINSSLISLVLLKENIRSLDLCIDICISINQHKYVAYDEESINCYCIKNLTNTFFNQLLVSKLDICQNTNLNPVMFYDTGFIKIPKFDEEYIQLSKSQIQDKFNQLKSENNLPRIVFLFTVNGRSIRQLFRLLKTIYNEWHYYYFHVDERMTFLRKEIKKLISNSNRNNLKMAEWSMPTIWGGNDLLKMHLKVMQELLEMKNDGHWNWDFILNLSETDFPIKTIEELTLYLNENRDRNFVKFHHSPFEEFSKNQGIYYAFYQCENRMWKLGKRELPLGIQFGGGSDWFCLNHKFIDYIINSKDPMLNKLMIFFNYTILPSETFFHTAILNTKFCNTFKNSHLKFVNWQRKRGCNCQYKHIVDWCGCSPNIITLNELYTIEVLKQVPIFFARKFDPLFEHQLINIIDQSMFGIYSTNFKSLNSYWHNFFDKIDTTIDTKLKILLDHLLKESNDIFIQRFNSLENHFKYSEKFTSFKKQNLLKQTLFEYLKSVNGYFEGNKYKGFVLTIRMYDESTKSVSALYETYFKMVSNKNLIEIDDTKLIKHNQSLFTNRNSILNNLIKLKISSDYDTKDRRFFNYISLMNQNTNPCLLMEFDPLTTDLEPFYIRWYDPNDQLVKETKVGLGKSDKNQQVLNTFFKKEEPNKYLNQTGLWHIKIFLFDKETSIFKIKFLILPNKNPFSVENDSSIMKKWFNLIKNFWTFDSICLHKIEDLNLKNTYLFDNLFRNCSETYWSTFYPDPKSDVFSNMSIDLTERIINL